MGVTSVRIDLLRIVIHGRGKCPSIETSYAVGFRYWVGVGFLRTMFLGEVETQDILMAGLALSRLIIYSADGPINVVLTIQRSYNPTSAEYQGR